MQTRSGEGLTQQYGNAYICVLLVPCTTISMYTNLRLSGFLAFFGILALRNAVQEHIKRIFNFTKFMILQSRMYKSQYWIDT